MLASHLFEAVTWCLLFVSFLLLAVGTLEVPAFVLVGREDTWARRHRGVQERWRLTVQGAVR